MLTSLLTTTTSLKESDAVLVQTPDTDETVDCEWLECWTNEIKHTLDTDTAFILIDMKNFSYYNHHEMEGSLYAISLYASMRAQKVIFIIPSEKMRRDHTWITMYDYVFITPSEGEAYATLEYLHRDM